MIQIRFHGRGGHGVKTASRIVGTAAFLAGFQAQDSRIYDSRRTEDPHLHLLIESFPPPAHSTVDSRPR
jgi:pyruvate ferredoxin oxidoreductase gamma subunit